MKDLAERVSLEDEVLKFGERNKDELCNIVTVEFRKWYILSIVSKNHGATMDDAKLRNI